MLMIKPEKPVDDVGPGRLRPVSAAGKGFVRMTADQRVDKLAAGITNTDE